jgi:hypothetical protein
LTTQTIETVLDTLLQTVQVVLEESDDEQREVANEFLHLIVARLVHQCDVDLGSQKF